MGLQAGDVAGSKRLTFAVQGEPDPLPQRTVHEPLPRRPLAMNSKIRRHSVRPLARTIAAGVIIVALQGCAAGVLVGGMIESYRETSTRPVPSEYDGLADKSFAVFIAADRLIQSNHPQAVARLTTLITQRLVENANAAGVVPPAVILEYQYNHPSWVAMTYDELAEHFGVDRLIYIDLYEFRLHEPGNAYLWGGVAAASVGVVEADGPLGDEFMYSKAVQVRFPDDAGYGPTEYSASQVSAVLEKRFVDRVTWLFYEHEEPYYPDY